MVSLFQFDPDASDAPLPKGHYRAEIVNAEIRTSKAGNTMLELTLSTTSPSGIDVFLKDYLVATPKAKWKIRDFCRALEIDYSAGAIDPTSITGRTVAIEVDVEEGRGDRDRSTVVGYHSAERFAFGAEEDADADAAADDHDGRSGKPTSSGKANTRRNGNGSGNGNGKRQRRSKGQRALDAEDIPF